MARDNGKAAEKRRCVFCGGTPTSNEHLLGRWAHRYWYGKDPDGSPLNDDASAPFTMVGSRALPDGEFGPARTALFDNRPATQACHTTVKAVCNPCNNGWMSALETAGRPLIIRLFEDRKVQFTRSEIATLIRWCQKTAVVIDCWSPHPNVVQPDVYHAIKANESVPGHWDIRVAHVEEDCEFAFSHVPLVSRAVIDGSDETFDEAPDRGATGLQVMIALGDVVFMVRYSAHEFRGATALDADYYKVRHPPATLLGKDARRIFKPGGWPRYAREDWDRWALWAVGKEPGVMAAVGMDEDGTTWVDDVSVALGDEYTVVDRNSRLLDVDALMAQEPSSR